MSRAIYSGMRVWALQRRRAVASSDTGDGARAVRVRKITRCDRCLTRHQSRVVPSTPPSEAPAIKDRVIDPKMSKRICLHTVGAAEVAYQKASQSARPSWARYETVNRLRALRYSVSPGRHIKLTARLKARWQPLGDDLPRRRMVQSTAPTRDGGLLCIQPVRPEVRRRTGQRVRSRRLPGT